MVYRGEYKLMMCFYNTQFIDMLSYTYLEKSALLDYLKYVLGVDLALYR